jgi:hypothetical protein
MDTVAEEIGLCIEFIARINPTTLCEKTGKKLVYQETDGLAARAKLNNILDLLSMTYPLLFEWFER